MRELETLRLVQRHKAHAVGFVLPGPAPPSRGPVIDDQDFSLATPIFETVLRALSAIEPPGGVECSSNEGERGEGSINKMS